MAVIKNKFTVDSDEAINAINRTQAAFLSYNSAIGAVAGQHATFNRDGKAAYQTIIQIDDAGRKFTTTLKATAAGWEVLAVKVGAATIAQRNNAAEAEKQKRISDALAKAVANRPTVGGPTPTALVGAVDPNKLKGVQASMAGITREQLALAASAHGLNDAEKLALNTIYDGANRGRTAMAALSKTTDFFKGKLQELGKIAFATAVYRGISLIQSAFSQGVQSATEFSYQIGLIQTLADDNEGSFEQWSAAVRKVADELGKPVTEVAAAAYEGLSSQILKSARDTDVLRQAVLLGKVTNSTSTEAMSVLAAITNVYGKEAGTAAQLTDKLFTTVDLGNVKLGQLAGVIGRSASLAKQLGVNINELAGAQIVLTQSGLESSEAGTLFNNVISQLLKPNEELSAALLKNGYTSGSTALSTLRLVGVLRLLNKETGGSAEALAKFFPDLRGLRGASVFTGEGLEKLASSIEEVANSSGKAQKANQELTANAGTQLAQEAQRLANFFTVEIGQKALAAVASLTKFFGGLDNIVKNFGGTIVQIGGFITFAFAAGAVFKFAGAIGTLSKSLVGLQAVITANRIATAAFGREIALTSSQFGIFVGTAVLGYVAVSNALNRLQQSQRDAAAELAKPLTVAYDAEIKAIDDNSTKRVAAFEKSVDQMTRTYGRFVAEAIAENRKLLDNTVEIGDKIAEGLENSLGALVDIAKKNLNAAEKAEEKLYESTLEAGKIGEAALEDLRERSYQRNIQNLESNSKGRQKILRQQAADELKLAYAQQNRALKPEDQLIKSRPFEINLNVGDAKAQLVKFRNDELREKLKLQVDRNEFDQAGRTLAQIFTHLDSLNRQGVRGIGEAQAAEFQNFQAQVLEKQALNKRQSDEQLEQIGKAKLQFKEFQDLVKKTQDLGTKSFDKEGNLDEKKFKTPDALLDAIQKSQEEVFKFVETLKLLDNPRLAKQLGVNLDDLGVKFQQQLANAEDRLALLAKNKALENAGTARKKLAEEEVALYKTLQTSIDENEKRLAASVTYIKKIAAEIKATTGSFTQSRDILDPFKHPLSGFNVGSQKEIARIESELSEELSRDYKDITALTRLRNELEAVIVKNAPDFKIVNPADAQTLITMKDALEELKTTIGNIAGSQAARYDAKTEIQELATLVEARGRGIDSVVSKANEALFKTLETERGIVATNEGLSANASALKAMADQTERLARAQAALSAATFNAANVQAKPIERAAGGKVTGNFLSDFIGGGYARGTDVIPAMLSKDEYVVRAAMAKKYYSQLVAINNDRPIYRSAGGPVSNTQNVGDIHVHVSGVNGKVDTRAVAREIRRGIQTGTMRIN